MKLYALPGTCAVAPNIALQWAGADYDVELIAREALKQPEYLAIHPLGKVPALVRNDGRVLTEVPAILDWIAEAYPGAGLGGTDADERYAINQWLAFLATEMHASAYGPHFAPQRFHPDEAEHDTVRATAHARLTGLYEILEDGMESGRYPVDGHDPGGPGRVSRPRGLPRGHGDRPGRGTGTGAPRNGGLDRPPGPLGRNAPIPTKPIP